MSTNSAIEWTGDTWNALAGCTEISPGCLHCYAAIMAHRLAAMAQADIAAGKDPGSKRKYIGTTRKLPSGKIAWTGKVNTDEEALLIPLQRKKPTVYFVNSMSDLFHADVPDEFIDKVFAVMALCPQHTFQVLTKRAERMAEYFTKPTDVQYADGVAANQQRYRAIGRVLRCEFGQYEPGYSLEHHGDGWPLSNVWLGVSVENKQHGLPRIEHLLRTPAAVRFLSVEPLLEEVRILDHLMSGCDPGKCLSCGKGHGFTRCPNYGGVSKTNDDYPRCDKFSRQNYAIHWVIAGGESGPGARPCNVANIRSIVNQCERAGVPCFVKQLGGNVICRNDEISEWVEECNHLQMKHTENYQGAVERVVGFKNKKGGDPNEWPEDLRVREMPRVKETVKA